MRITGGEWRSRLLQVPPDQTITRPTMDQTRQAVFNILGSAAWAQKPNGQSVLLSANILDVYAGCGAYGFESLSRGAAFVTFIEQDAKAVDTIRKNTETLKCSVQTKILRADALKTGPNPGEVATLCFLDPPYADESWPETLAHLAQRRWVDDNTLIVLEAGSKTARETNILAEDILLIHDHRIYGKSFVLFGNIKYKQ